MSGNSSWMGDLLKDRPDFGDIPITRMMLAGSHDSGTIGMDERARTQDQTIEQQLKLGLRYFDLRPRLHGSDYYIHHGILGSDNTLARWPAPSDLDTGPEIFAQLRRFLKANPHEVVILRYSDYSDFTRDEDYSNFVSLMRTYFTFDVAQPVKSRCGLVRLPQGTRPYVNQQTLNTLIAAGERVFVIFDVKNAPVVNEIWDYVFHSKGDKQLTKPSEETLVLWDPYWEDKSSSLADDDAANVKNVWFPWHQANLKSWNGDGFFVLQSQMQVLHPTGNGAPGFFNKAERSAKATSALYRYPDNALISNNDRNGSEYLTWLQAGAPVNIVTFDFAQYGDLPDKIIAHYRKWRLISSSAQRGNADWSGKLREEHKVSLAQATRIADSDPKIGFFFYVKSGPVSFGDKGPFQPGTAVFFSGAPTPGTSGYSDLYVRMPK